MARRKTSSRIFSTNKYIITGNNTGPFDRLRVYYRPPFGDIGGHIPYRRLSRNNLTDLIRYKASLAVNMEAVKNNDITYVFPNDAVLVPYDCHDVPVPKSSPPRSPDPSARIHRRRLSQKILHSAARRKLITKANNFKCPSDEMFDMIQKQKEMIRVLDAKVRTLEAKIDSDEHNLATVAFLVQNTLSQQHQNVLHKVEDAVERLTGLITEMPIILD